MIQAHLHIALGTSILSSCVGIIGVMLGSGATAVSDTRRGELLFAQSCASCHATRSKERLVGPGLKGYFPKQNTVIKDDSVRDIIVHGRGTMPGFTTLSHDQIDDLISYLKTL
jgi:mono/diheme cytochrome c family protein